MAFSDQVWLMAGLLAVAGCFSGFLAGLLGVGGGIVVVPALFHVLGAFDVPIDLRMHLAIGTSLGSIVPTSIISLRAHHRRRGVDWPLFKEWAPWIALGVVLGSLVASMARGTTLTLIFAVMALVIACYLAFARSDYHLAKSLPGSPWRQLICMAIGTFSAMMGIGGGSFTVPTLTLCSYPIRRAVGTASAVGLLIAVPGALSFVVTGWGMDGLPPASWGYVNMLAVAALVPSSLVFAPLGARVAHTVPGEFLRKFFALFLLATSMRMFFSLA